MANLRQTRRKQRKKRRLKRGAKFAIIIFFTILIAVVSYAGYLYVKANSMLGNSYEDVGREKSELREKIVDPTKDNFSILIVGADTSEARAQKGNPRSDTLIYATFNKKNNSVKLLSIPRDTLVYVPYLEKETKINHAYSSSGGIKATIETVENLLELPVDYYVSINFEAFIEIVDALDGITVEVPYEIYEQNSKDEKNAIHLLPGIQYLNGEEALAFARTRKYDNDIERGKRQQQIIKAIVDKALSLDSVLKYGDIIDVIGDNMKTNIRTNEILGLISHALREKSLDIDTLTLKGFDYKPDRIYYYKLDEESLEETKDILREHLGYK